MWDKVAKCLEGYPERLAVARILIKNGLSVRNGRIYCGEIVIPTVRISRAAGVDRRTVMQTVKMIEDDPELSTIFRGIRPAGTSLREIARYLDLGVIEITPVDARMPGILACSAMLLAEKNISIRQAIVDDPELTPEPKLTLIAEKKIPGELIPELLKVKGVSKLSVY
ncbi:amino acid-binding protein [Candidatus Bathyarchaeota archaeon ex4484_231]|nr:MAG: amino acid-binding protein [Candidatus Bathyarchaeota archaeon ex4484_231]RJS75322.1 MAG: amino acid-binding protein [Candidatus Bathyarchaeota archaeon]